jgi:nitroreductase
MNLSELVEKNRSYRRFLEKEKITVQQIEKWIGLSRLTASGRNNQPLKYIGSVNPELNAGIFRLLAWAGYLTDWPGPAEGERPAAYIVVMHDKSISENRYCDDGIAVQTILLGAVEDGYGGCIIGSVNKAKLAALLQLREHLEIIWVIALGKPAETVVIEEMKGDDVKYWRDENQIHHVPKRALNQLILSVIP